MASEDIIQTLSEELALVSADSQNGTLYNDYDEDYGEVIHQFQVPKNPEDPLYKSPDPGSRFLTLVLPLLIVCLLGVVGNALVLAVICRQPRGGKVTYLYLANLALVNLLCLLSTLPLTAASYVLADWPFGRLACQVTSYVTSVCLAVSVLTLMATCLDRYLAVVHPLSSRRFRTETKAKLVMAGVWLVSGLMMTYRIFIFDVFPMRHVHDYYECRHSEPHEGRVDAVLQLLGLYLLPLLVMTFCHLRIGLLLWHRRRPGQGQSVVGGQGEVNLVAMKERRRIARVVLAVTLAFALFWLPVHVLGLHESLSSLHGPARLLTHHHSVLVFSFCFAVSSVNPLLYCVLSRHFRTHFRQALTCVTSCAGPSHQQEQALVLAEEATTDKRLEAAPREHLIIIDLENELGDHDYAEIDDGQKVKEVVGGDVYHGDKSGSVAATKKAPKMARVLSQAPEKKEQFLNRNYGDSAGLHWTTNTPVPLPSLCPSPSTVTVATCPSSSRQQGDQSDLSQSKHPTPILKAGELMPIVMHGYQEETMNQLRQIVNKGGLREVFSTTAELPCDLPSVQ